MTTESHYVAVKCRTLGTKFRDIEKDGELWAREVPAALAERFVAEPWLFGNVHADTPKLRVWVLEMEEATLRATR